MLQNIVEKVVFETYFYLKKDGHSLHTWQVTILGRSLKRC